jgi:hypothetical protein
MAKLFTVFTIKLIITNWKSQFRLLMPYLAVLILLQGCAVGFNFAKSSEVADTQASKTISMASTSPWQLTATETTPLIPTQRATSTPTLVPSLTFTPLSTLEQRGIQGLLNDNGGCQLPCWWGIEPGKTTKQQTQPFLEQFATEIDINNYGYIEVDGKIRNATDYLIRFTLPGKTDQGEIDIDVWDDSVVRIAVGEKTTAYHYTIDQLLNDIGKPYQVYIRSGFSELNGVVPFHLILYYPDHRFFAHFDIEAKEDGDNIKACLSKLGPELVMWAPEYRVEDRLEEEMIGPELRVGLQNLEDATGLTLDEFYTTFSELGNNECLKTPVEFWKYLWLHPRSTP